MKISTKGRYGLTAMVDLAINSNSECISLKSIAERQNISEGYLEQIFSLLKKSNLVNSVKGMQGGYILAQSSSTITVATMLKALEGELTFGKGKAKEGVNEATIEYAIEVNIWDKIDDSIDEILSSVTLEDLVKYYETSLTKKSAMYFI